MPVSALPAMDKLELTTVLAVYPNVISRALSGARDKLGIITTNDLVLGIKLVVE